MIKTSYLPVPNSIFASKHRCAAVLLSILTSAPLVTAAEPTASAAKSETAASANSADEFLRFPGKRKHDAFLRSISDIEARLRANPNDAAAHVALADLQIYLWCYGFAPYDEVMPRGEAAARRALQLDPNLAGAHTSLGVALLGRRDWKNAEHHLRLATEGEPDRAVAHHWYALYLAAMGRRDEADKHSRRAAELDPSLGMRVARSSILYFQRDWQGMIDVLKPAIQQDANHEAAYDWLGMAYVQQRQFDQAIPTYRRAAELSDGLAEVLGGLGHCYARAGRKKEAREVLNKLERLDERWHIPPVQIAFVYIGLGQKQQALDLLERAYDQRSWELVFLQAEPWLDDLRTEPRFIELVEKMKFPE